MYSFYRHLFFTGVRRYKTGRDEMRFPTWFRDASIRRKFIFIAFLATLTATLFAILLSTLIQWFMLREELLKSISAQASLIAANSAAELAHNDREGAKKTVGALANIDNIEFAGILDKEETILRTIRVRDR